MFEDREISIEIQKECNKIQEQSLDDAGWTVDHPYQARVVSSYSETSSCGSKTSNLSMYLYFISLIQSILISPISEDSHGTSLSDGDHSGYLSKPTVLN